METSIRNRRAALGAAPAQAASACAGQGPPRQGPFTATRPTTGASARWPISLPAGMPATVPSTVWNRCATASRWLRRCSSGMASDSPPIRPRACRGRFRDERTDRVLRPARVWRPRMQHPQHVRAGLAAGLTPLQTAIVAGRIQAIDAKRVRDRFLEHPLNGLVPDGLPDITPRRRKGRENTAVGPSPVLSGRAARAIRCHTRKCRSFASSHHYPTTEGGDPQNSV